MKILRWIAVPFMFPLGMILGHLSGLTNGVFVHSIIGEMVLEFICGALAAGGSIMLPALVAPTNKKSVANIAFYLQIVFLSISVAITIMQNLYSEKELFAYIVAIIGGVVGIIYSKKSIPELFSEQ